jgi:FtsH-binding integral membrane protein
MKQNKLRPLLPLSGVFLVVSAISFTGSEFLNHLGLNGKVLGIGNIIVYLATVLSYFLGLRGLGSANPHAFVRSVYVSIMLKFFICLLAALIYIITYRSNINKPAIFVCMGLYLVYTFIEVRILMQQLKAKPNV